MKLFWKLFATLGFAITIAMVAAVTLGFYIGQKTFEQWLESDASFFFEREQVITRASTALASGGREALTAWLRENQTPITGRTLFIADENLQDLLGRELPRTGRIFLGPGAWRSTNVGVFGGRRPGSGGGGGGNRGFANDGRSAEWMSPTNRTPPSYVETLKDDATGESFYPLFKENELTLLYFLNLPTTRFGVVTLAVVMAAFTALLLAKSLSSPIVRLQRATRGLAAGMLDTRVGAPFNRRKDELGTLARDFDTMAEQIQALITDKEVLLRDVSHELRSPLARMQVALALAQRKVPDEAQADLVRIEQEAEKLDQLVGQILTLARLRSSPLEQGTEVQLQDVVREVVADARFEHPDVSLTFNSDSLPAIEGNAVELGSAIENVLRNALLHAGPSAEVSVNLKQISDSIRITVADNGPGVPDEALNHLFEPFYRADPSRDHNQSGYGLGLAIASSIIERHGGNVAARNRSGGGLEITFNLPARTRSMR